MDDFNELLIEKVKIVLVFAEMAIKLKKTITSDQKVVLITERNSDVFQKRVILYLIFVSNLIFGEKVLVVNNEDMVTERL